MPHHKLLCVLDFYHFLYLEAAWSLRPTTHLATESGSTDHFGPFGSGRASIGSRMSHSTLGKRKPVQQNVQGGAGQGSANHGSASSSSISEVTIKVNRLQRGNPLLQHLTNMPWAFTKPLDADYVVGRAACVLFLSVKYHMLHPKYLLARMGKLRFKYTVRILLCQVDRQNDEPLQEISRLAFVNGWSLLCAWSPRECARYIETLKSYESKSADSLKKKVDKHNSAKTLESAITTIRSVNSKDVKTLAVNFGSFKNIAEASMDKLAICPGLGPKKIKRIYRTFRMPFKR